MFDARAGRVWSYPDQGDLLHSEIAVPTNAPGWLLELTDGKTPAQASQALWNHVVASERQENAQTAREFVIALPIEFTADQNIALMQTFVAAEFTGKGMIADWVFHDKPGNPHVHLMHTMRPIEADDFGKKRIQLIDADGQPRRNGIGKLVYRQFIGGKGSLIDLRTAWAATVTRELAAHGFDQTLDLSSYASRDIKLDPTRHIGPAGTAILLANEPSKSAAASASSKELSRAQLEANPQLIVDLVAEQHSVFDQRDIAKALHRFFPDASGFTRAYQAAINTPGLVKLADEITDTDGVLIEPNKFALQAMIDLEHGMSDDALRLSSSHNNTISPVAVADALRTAPRQLSDEQAAAVQHITTGADLAVVVGFAGAGKSTLLAAANAAWDASGKHVVGAALAGKASSELAKASNIHSRTIAAWTSAWSRGDDRLTSDHVFVLDEAGMAGSADIAAILTEVTLSGAKLVLVGDPEQLQPISAGGAFRVLIEQTTAFELSSVRRQNHDWAREASINLQRGHTEAALNSYHQRGAISFHPEHLGAATSLITSYNASLGDSQSASRFASQIAMAHTNDDVHALNIGIRNSRSDLGQQFAVATSKGTRTFAAGDRIAFLKNHTFDGTVVHNGELGSVTAIEPRLSGSGLVVTVATDAGARVQIDTSRYQDFDHGYAVTIHKLQGATVDRSFILGSAMMDKSLGYVALTRHREEPKLFIPQSEIPDMAALVKVLSRSEPKVTTLDYAARRSVSNPPTIPLALAPLTRNATEIISAARDALSRAWAGLSKSINLLSISSLSLRSDPAPQLTQGQKIMQLQHIKTTEIPGNKIAATWGRDQDANDFAKQAGAKWDKESSTWHFKANSPDTDRAFKQIDARMTDIATSKELSNNVAAALRSPNFTATVTDKGALAIQGPKDPEFNAILKSQDASWSRNALGKGNGAFVIEVKGDAHAAKITDMFGKADAYLNSTVASREVTTALNDKYPGINASVDVSTAGEHRLSLRPPFHKEIISVLKNSPLGAAWEAVSSSWRTQVSIADAPKVASPQLAAISEKAQVINQASPELAKGVTSDHGLIAVSHKNGAVIVHLPKDGNAGMALNRAGFDWQPKITAYAAVPETEADTERLQRGINNAGLQLNRALIPHTPERTGIPAINGQMSDLLKMKPAEAAQVYATDAQVRGRIDSMVEKLAEFGTRAQIALTERDPVAFSAMTGVPEDRAAVAMNVMEAVQNVKHEGETVRAAAEVAHAHAHAQSKSVEGPAHSM